MQTKHVHIRCEPILHRKSLHINKHWIKPSYFFSHYFRCLLLMAADFFALKKANKNKPSRILIACLICSDYNFTNKYPLRQSFPSSMVSCCDFYQFSKWKREKRISNAANKLFARITTFYAKDKPICNGSSRGNSSSCSYLISIAYTSTSSR